MIRHLSGAALGVVLSSASAHADPDCSLHIVNPADGPTTIAYRAQAGVETTLGQRGLELTQGEPVDAASMPGLQLFLPDTTNSAKSFLMRQEELLAEMARHFPDWKQCVALQTDDTKLACDNAAFEVGRHRATSSEVDPLSALERSLARLPESEARVVTAVIVTDGSALDDERAGEIVARVAARGVQVSVLYYVSNVPKLKAKWLERLAQETHGLFVPFSQSTLREAFAAVTNYTLNLRVYPVLSAHALPDGEPQVWLEHTQDGHTTRCAAITWTGRFDPPAPEITIVGDEKLEVKTSAGTSSSMMIVMSGIGSTQVILMMLGLLAIVVLAFAGWRLYERHVKGRVTKIKSEEKKPKEKAPQNNNGQPPIEHGTTVLEEVKAASSSTKAPLGIEVDGTITWTTDSKAIIGRSSQVTLRVPAKYDTVSAEMVRLTLNDDGTRAMAELLGRNSGVVQNLGENLEIVMKQGQLVPVWNGARLTLGKSCVVKLHLPTVIDPNATQLLAKPSGTVLELATPPIKAMA